MKSRSTKRRHVVIYMDCTEDDRIGWSALIRQHGEMRPDDEWIVLSDYHPIGSGEARSLEMWSDAQLIAWLRTLRFWSGKIVVERD